MIGDDNRKIVLLYEYLWYKEVKLINEIEEKQRACKLMKHTPDDLISLYLAEKKYKDFMEMYRQITEIIDLS